MPDPTGAERERRRRERKAGRLPPVARVQCSGPGCVRVHTGAHGLYCWSCWEKCDPLGRLAKTQRVRDTRARAKARANRNNP